MVTFMTKQLMKSEVVITKYSLAKPKRGKCFTTFYRWVLPPSFAIHQDIQITI